MTDYPFNADKPIKADTITNFCIYTEQNAEHIFRSLFGFVRRAKFRWKDADEIYIGPGCYHHYGSTRNRLVWWNSELTFKLGSAGSNGSSDDVDDGAVTWHYIYIDDSAVNSLASNELTAAEFLNDTTAPTWSDTYHGFYNGNDRCIGAVLASAANAVLEFFHDGSEYIQYADNISEYSGAPSSTWTDVDLTSSIPGFCTRAALSIRATYGDAGSVLYCRVNGQTGATGIVLGTAGAAASYDTIVSAIATSSAQVIEVKYDTATTNTVIINTVGWYFPRGM